MTETPEVQAGPVVKVARDLTAIVELYALLPVQAFHDANSPLMPGGEAMVFLAPVGSPDEWAELIANEELRHLATCSKPEHKRCRYAEHVADGDDDESALQTLLFWSEQWREERGYPLEGRRPNEATEANFIRGSLDWAYERELHWDDFASDMRRARAVLERRLRAGEPVERGVPCLYDECRGVRLTRKLEPCRTEDGAKGWRFTAWHCPRCKRRWDEDAYARHVTAQHELAKVEDIDGETWCTTEYAARQVGRPEATVRVWVHRGQVARACIVKGRRVFVRLADVVTRHEASKRRGRDAA